jgi:DNA-binding MarR family transcriptional regulator
VTYYLMAIANLIAKNTAQRTLRGSGLSVNDWRVLRFFAQSGPAPATQVIAAIGIDKTTVGRVITFLQSTGLAELAPNPADRRQTLIALTAKGRRLHDRIYPIDRGFDSSFETQLTPAESRVLRPILVKLRNHAQVLLEDGSDRSTVSGRR